MNALALILVLSQTPDSKSLADARAKATAAQSKLSDLRATMSKLLSNVDALQQEISSETAALEAARAAIAKTEKELNDYILGEEQRLIDIRKIIFNSKPPLKMKANPKGKDIYGDGLETSVKPPITNGHKPPVAKPPSVKPFDADAFKPRGTPKDIGNVEKEDGTVLRWWTYSDRPKMIFLYSGELLLGVWSDRAYRRAVNGVVVDEPVPQAPVPLPKD